MRRLLLSLILSMAVWCVPALAGDAPAGYIVGIEPADGGKAVVVRKGEELVPKLLMPLYAEDVVDLRGSDVRIDLELGDGKTETVDSGNARYPVSGEFPTGDDALSILTAIGSILSGDSEELPDNMASKGMPPDFRMPLAVREANYILKDHDRLWLAWIGGKPQFTLSSAVKTGGDQTELARTETHEADVALPGADRFRIDVVDGDGSGFRVFFRRVGALPPFPDTLKKAAPGPTAALLMQATWLASIDDGRWTIEAAQLLRDAARDTPAAAELLDRLVKGWKPQSQ